MYKFDLYTLIPLTQKHCFSTMVPQNFVKDSAKIVEYVKIFKPRKIPNILRYVAVIFVR